MPTMTRPGTDADACARELLDVVPLATRWLRAAIRRHEPAWSLPQLQALGFLQLNPDASLSDLAGELGVTLPTASTLVSRLVAANHVDRREDPASRRRVLLRLTPKGETRFETALATGQAQLAERLRALSVQDLTRVCRALSVLRAVFGEA